METLSQVLSPLLHTFTALENLRIEGILWPLLTPDLKESFHAVLALPSLTRFDCSHLQFSKLEFVGLLYPHLKRLSVDYIEFLPPPWDFERRKISKKEIPRLEYLTFGSSDKDLDFVDLCLESQSIVDISKVHTLELRCYYGRGVNVLSRLLKRLGLSLENLNLELGLSFFFYENS